MTEGERRTTHYHESSLVAVDQRILTAVEHLASGSEPPELIKGTVNIPFGLNDGMSLDYVNALRQKQQWLTCNALTQETLGSQPDGKRQIVIRVGELSEDKLASNDLLAQFGLFVSKDGIFGDIIEDPEQLREYGVVVEAVKTRLASKLYVWKKSTEAVSA